MSTAIQNGSTPVLGVDKATASLNFTKKVERQFAAELGSGIQWTDLQRALAQHLFIKIQQSIDALNVKRTPENQITWPLVNMPKLAIDSVHRVALGLDALIPNHISVVPYWNSKAGLFDIDLRIGFMGVDHSRRGLALDPPEDIIYELVHASDKFVPLKRDSRRDSEDYIFEITSPFDRGEIVGGFGYIKYSDPRKNRLYIITDRDFQRAMDAAQSKDFWNKNPNEMRFKTIVHRVGAKIPLDPAKVNPASLSALESASSDAAIAEFDEVVAVQANQGVLTAQADTTMPAPSANLSPVQTLLAEEVPATAKEPF